MNKNTDKNQDNIIINSDEINIPIEYKKKNLKENIIKSNDETNYNIDNININYFKKLITPNELINKVPNNENNKLFIIETRKIIENIIKGQDKRKLLIVGPCSIHNIDEAKKYALMLKNISLKVIDKIFIVMRVYFEKPRTTIGWKGMINDPDLNNSFNIDKGLFNARELLQYITNIELPTAYEVLDTFTPQYISDLISWAAVGARTTESQVHRQLVSGLSMPVGFKNNTSGNTKVAIDAIKSAKNSHCFYGITYDGFASVISTMGNNYCHVILRGSDSGPNYFNKDIESLKKEITENKLTNKNNIMIDCSHGNSYKDYKNQEKVWEYILDNYIDDQEIFGFMLESNINEGSQKLTNPKELKYGISITDSCISFSKTIELVMKMYNKL